MCPGMQDGVEGMRREAKGWEMFKAHPLKCWLVFSIIVFSCGVLLVCGRYNGFIILSGLFLIIGSLNLTIFYMNRQGNDEGSPKKEYHEWAKEHHFE